MVTRWLHLAYKVKTDVDPGGGVRRSSLKTDEDCRGDQVIDSVTKLCAGACPDGQHPANGRCSNGPRPVPSSSISPASAALSIPTIPGWSPNPQPQRPSRVRDPQPQPNQPTQPSTWPGAVEPAADLPARLRRSSRDVAVASLICAVSRQSDRL